jgi:hypothetical protein
MRVWEVSIVKTSGTTRASWRRAEQLVGIYGSREAAFLVLQEQERMLKWAQHPYGERFRVQFGQN